MFEIRLARYRNGLKKLGRLVSQQTDCNERTFLQQSMVCTLVFLIFLSVLSTCMSCNLHFGKMFLFITYTRLDYCLSERWARALTATHDRYFLVKNQYVLAVYIAAVKHRKQNLKLFFCTKVFHLHNGLSTDLIRFSKLVPVPVV